MTPVLFSGQETSEKREPDRERKKEKKEKKSVHVYNEYAIMKFMRIYRKEKLSHSMVVLNLYLLHLVSI